MPVINKGNLQIDYTAEGSGQAVVLIHSSVNGNRQWLKLIECLQDRYRVVAPNLFGYGESAPWTEPGSQTLADQATLIELVCESENFDPDSGIYLAGHSFGGSVALEMARTGKQKISKLVLIQPNPFYLRDESDNHAALEDVLRLERDIRRHAVTGDWEAVSERFADYWLGNGGMDSYAIKSPERIYTGTEAKLFRVGCGAERYGNY